MTNRQEWKAFTQNFHSKRILVVGDLMLDRYWYGTVARVSPEAPVVVISKTRSVFSPGGAANTAANVASLEGQVSLIGVIGVDEAAGQMRVALEQRGIRDCALIEDPQRPTTVKTRVVAHHQHVVRIDEESTQPISPAIQQALVREVESRLPDTHGLILSDYRKGVLSEGCTTALVEVARRAGVPLFVDPKGRNFERYVGVTLLKPNRAELALLTGAEVSNHEATLAAGQLLAAQLGGAALLVTEGAEGMTLFQPDRDPFTLRAHSKAVFDVTGAGDTVIATLALACAAGADLPAAVQMANRAAALVVEKLGTDVCTLPELLAAD